ncbi:MAG TPA: chemotaxis protein CheW [Blastocatellia bacterium]|nr:chemotaxis protein CheW [Blastocatellia bacterium]
MFQAAQTIVHLLTQIRRELEGASSEESAVSDHGGDSLESLIPQIAEADPEVAELLTLILEGRPAAGAPRDESSPLGARLMQALAAAEEFFQAGESPGDRSRIRHSIQSLQQAWRQSSDGRIEEAALDEPHETAAPAPATAHPPSEYESDVMKDLLRDFLVECYENLDQLDRDLLTLERDPSSTPTLANIFRTIHTIKGTCGFFGLAKLESVTHVGENLLSRLRDGKLHLTSEIASGLLALVDAVRQLLTHLETDGNEGDTDYGPLVRTLTELQRRETVPAEAPDESENQVVWHQVQEGAAAPRKTGPSSSGEARAPNAPSLADNSLRVDVGLLDVLMNLVGELVLARNQILQYTVTQADSGFAATSQRLNLITTELQEGVMKTRMQPIGNIWGKFPRFVRDLAVNCAKKIRIEMEGKETEMDKTIIEAIKDPLTHLVRNSADHGIESPAVRVAKQKSPEGHIFLRAFHEGGQVNIEISDDGAGIDPERVKQKALQRGLITAEQLARMSDREAVNLIFLPGFSTAEQVTNISGRGVGMDVVKTNIEKIGGTIDVHSKPGQGTTIKIKIPLTLAIIPALIVTTGGDRYAIPQVSLLELVRLEGEQARAAIELIYGAPVYRLRGNLLPLIYLNRELRVERPAAENDEEAAVNIVVLRADDRQFGMVVDEINDTEEIVVKPLSKQLKGLTSFAGATIMGDGKVALILDVLGLAQRANVVSEVRDRALPDTEAKNQERPVNAQTLLLFRVGEAERMAIPLSLVARLEEFPVSAIERAGRQEVVQYRGQIMPLIRLAQVFNCPRGGDSAASDQMQVVVYTSQRRSVGLVVDQILDIVEESVVLQHCSKRSGVVGSAVIQQRVTDLLDVRGIIQSIDPSLIEQSAAA